MYNRRAFTSFERTKLVIPFVTSVPSATPGRRMITMKLKKTPEHVLPARDTLARQSSFRTVTRRRAPAAGCERAKRTENLSETGKKKRASERASEEERRTSERAALQSTGRCARGRERERPGGKWQFEIEERCESPHGFTGCHNPAPAQAGRFSFQRREVHNVRPRHGKSANHEAILGRRKRRTRSLIERACARDSNKN